MSTRRTTREVSLILFQCFFFQGREVEREESPRPLVLEREESEKKNKMALVQKIEVIATLELSCPFRPLETARARI